jgi:adenylate kinase
MINILGLAGSGKSTQAQALATKLNCPWISMSQLLREYGDDQVRAQMLEGKIIDDKITLRILDEDLKRKKADKKECIIDGWPRAITQAEWLAQKVKSGDIMMSGVVHLKAHQGIAKERLIHRGRVDDTEEAITQRFKDYKTTILPILDYLATHGFKIYEVDGDGPIDEVEQRIDQLLGLK